jgi:radical S-adenosyl methionine domain-containing protein 2
VFQVRPIKGQNDGCVEDLLITNAQFKAFVDRHTDRESQNVMPIAETNDEMTGSYLMVDTLGRFFNNTEGHCRYSDPIASVGVAAALTQTGWDAEKFIKRGEVYSWKEST